MDVRARLLIWQTRLVLRRAARERRRRLVRELSSYTTPAELAELEAIMERYPAGQTHELRALLNAQRRQLGSHVHRVA